MFQFSGCEAYGILAPWSGIEPAPTHEVLTTGQPGEFPFTFKLAFFKSIHLSLNILSMKLSHYYYKWNS